MTIFALPRDYVTGGGWIPQSKFKAPARSSGQDETRAIDVNIEETNYVATSADAAFPPSTELSTASPGEAVQEKLTDSVPLLAEASSMLLRRLMQRQASMIRAAEEYRSIYGDPIQRLAGLLSDVPRDPTRWQEIIDEPYG